MERKKTDYQIYLEVTASCEAHERFRRWEKEKEALNQASENCKASLASAWGEYNLFTSKYGTPRR